jgi:hypothetical protein
LAFSPDGGRLVTAQARQIRILETHDWQDVATLSVPDEMGHLTAFQPTGATLITVSPENIRVWRVEVAPPLKAIQLRHERGDAERHLYGSG